MFDILEFISKIFKKDKEQDTVGTSGSSSAARERLKLVLVSDRASMSPHLMESLRTELIQVISRYMTIDTSMMEVGVERRNGSLALAANIPILGVKRGNSQQQPAQQQQISVPVATEEKPKTQQSSKPQPQMQEPDDDITADEEQPSQEINLNSEEIDIRSEEIALTASQELQLRRKSRKASRKSQTKTSGKASKKQHSGA